jgi:hypothetical protein
VRTVDHEHGEREIQPAKAPKRPKTPSPPRRSERRNRHGHPDRKSAFHRDLGCKLGRNGVVPMSF